MSQSLRPDEARKVELWLASLSDDERRALRTLVDEKEAAKYGIRLTARQKEVAQAAVVLDVRRNPMPVGTFWKCGHRGPDVPSRYDEISGDRFTAHIAASECSACAMATAGAKFAARRRSS